MLSAALIASSGFSAPVSRAAAQVRAPSAQMYDISAFGNIWGIDAKKAVFDAWDPEQPRTYENFNPFERNDESASSDSNGCFPGQSRGYRPPNRPDQSWAIMQLERQQMDELAKNPKFGLKGRPGCFSLKWQENLGMPPIYDSEPAAAPPPAAAAPPAYTPPAAAAPPAYTPPPAAYAPPAAAAHEGGKGFGGGEATRDPAPTVIDPNDPKGKQQAIHKAESFADYLAKRQAAGGGSIGSAN